MIDISVENNIDEKFLRHLIVVFVRLTVVLLQPVINQKMKRFESNRKFRISIW